MRSDERGKGVMIHLNQVCAFPGETYVDMRVFVQCGEERRGRV